MAGVGRDRGGRRVRRKDHRKPDRTEVKSALEGKPDSGAFHRDFGRSVDRDGPLGEVFRQRIRQERAKFGRDGHEASDNNYATLVAEFERLTVDREFAEQKYIGALSAFNSITS